MSLKPADLLMPLYALASWYGLIVHGGSGKHILPVAIVGWVWAAINIARTKRLDLGVVTFFLVLLACLAERHYGFTRGVKLALSCASIAVAGNYSLVIALWAQISRDLSKVKSPAWITIFYCYCAAMMAWWVCAAAKNWMRAESNGYRVV